MRHFSLSVFVDDGAQHFDLRAMGWRGAWCAAWRTARHCGFTALRTVRDGASVIVEGVRADGASMSLVVSC